MLWRTRHDTTGGEKKKHYQIERKFCSLCWKNVKMASCYQRGNLEVTMSLKFEWPDFKASNGWAVRFTCHTVLVLYQRTIYLKTINTILGTTPH